MNMAQIGNLLNRPRLYNNIDGVGELVCGVMLLGYALIWWILAYTPGSSVWHKTVMIDFAALTAIIHYGSKAIKEHITYPRTGYVEYRSRDSLWYMVLGAAVTGAIILALVVASHLHWNLTTPARFVGLVFAAGYYRVARTARWKWAAFALMVAGSLVIAFQTADVAEAFLLTFIVTGTIWLVSGGISFWLYLRHTQPPDREAQ